MLPVLLATLVPGGMPAGIPARNCCRLRMFSMIALDESEAARPWAMAAISTARSRAVVVLLSPRSYAFWSSTPRRTTIESAPRRRADAWIADAPS
jgi:hypothetical protein